MSHVWNQSLKGGTAAAVFSLSWKEQVPCEIGTALPCLLCLWPSPDGDGWGEWYDLAACLFLSYSPQQALGRVAFTVSSYKGQLWFRPKKMSFSQNFVHPLSVVLRTPSTKIHRAYHQPSLQEISLFKSIVIRTRASILHPSQPVFFCQKFF